jgi:hypothetical protein
LVPLRGAGLTARLGIAQLQPPRGAFPIKLYHCRSFPPMRNNTPEIETLHIRALGLKAQIQALGGLVGSEPGFEENHPDLMIQFYERVLAEDRRINGPPASGGAN